jgi:hypothetical protein
VSGQPELSDGIHFDEPEAVAARRFCPRCGREAGAHASLCDHCGETLRAQGYCRVCERYWRRPVGADCPKHEIPLDDAPPPAPHDDPAAAGARWVTVQVFPDSLAAEAPRQRLEAEGIPTFVDGSRMGSRSMYHVAAGGVKLQVPEPLLADARILLAQTWAPLKFDDDLDDAWEELAPEPGAGAGGWFLGLLVMLVVGPFALWLIGWLLGLDVRLTPRPLHGRR